jgi:ribosomal-protein-alanine N-acetyltransferase
MLTSSDYILHTPRLLLRPLTSGDEIFMWPHMLNPEISRFMAWRPHTELEQTRRFVQDEMSRLTEGRGVTWALIHNSQLCGIASVIGVMREHRALIYNKGELAYWLAPSFQGQGLMTEALQRVVAFSFTELGLHKLCVSHFSCNDASRRVIERLGFRFIGIQTQEFCKDGIWHDHVLYEMLHQPNHHKELAAV